MDGERRSGKRLKTRFRAGTSTGLRAGPSTGLRAGPSTGLRAGPPARSTPEYRGSSTDTLSAAAGTDQKPGGADDGSGEAAGDSPDRKHSAHGQGGQSFFAHSVNLASERLKKVCWPAL